MNVKLSIYESKKVKIERLVKYIILLLDTIDCSRLRISGFLGSVLLILVISSKTSWD